MDKQLLKEMINQKLVMVQKHPKANLWIHNYSPKVQYEKLWNEITLMTRGLILDGDMNIVARPFGKFFNLEEHQPNELPSLAFDVFEKMDGSLGILYWLNDIPYIATRGSFQSEQAIHATELLHTQYHTLFDKLDRKKTYLFEIIYPQNRIVVDYGMTNDLVLLTCIDNETGEESMPDIGFSMVKKHDGIHGIDELRKLDEDNREGFVIRFTNNFRVKMKFAEYVRLHRIITNVSNVVIWEYISQNKSFQELLDKVPDEFYDYVKKTQHELHLKFQEIFNISMAAYLKCFSKDRKKFAIAVIKDYKEYSSIIFNIFDGKEPAPAIWKMCRPIYSKPFKTEI